ncbi:OmpA family protein [Sphingobacterium alkalisoli]|uniref:OmpA family protein n=2 Tax=Sphingobacterium alkalisoli TaxID=1874115 RepID=A0A4U0GQX5_9SPHI|nr:OmpA family protein [Sphingobacterium alkalisoli]GGH30788.1 cell envelope biogenesis protein OmpA [Sphingobacterium alkalisoli]
MNVFMKNQLTYYKTTVTAGLLFCISGICAQELPNRQQGAAILYEQMEYARAAEVLEPLVDRKRPRTEDMELLAKSHLQINRYDRALNWYTRVVQQADVSPVSLEEYATVLQLNGRYDEAKDHYTQLLQSRTSDPSIVKAIEGVDSAMVWMQHPTGHQLTNLKAINSASSDFGFRPQAGAAIYATEADHSQSDVAGMTGKPYLRLFEVQQDGDQGWRDPQLMTGSFNRFDYHVGPVAVRPSDQAMYITRTAGGRLSAKSKGDGVKWSTRNLEIKIYKKEGLDWVASDFPYNKVDQYSVGHAAFSPDGNILYFSSDMPGGKGGADIWYCQKQDDGSWGVPRNAGEQINSSGNELFPSTYGTDTLFFSSDGHVGMGGLDVFRVVGSGVQFSAPVNLGFPLNSSADDFAFVLEEFNEDGNQGYLASNRIGGMGSDDVYHFAYSKPKIQITLEVEARDKKTGEHLSGAAVTLLDKQAQTVAKAFTDPQGRIRFSLEKNTPYDIQGEQKGYHLDRVSQPAVRALRDTTVYLRLDLQPISTVGERFVLDDIFYDFDKHHIRPDAALVLDQLVSTLRSNPSLAIELSSHTDSRGSDAYNMRLSQRRAQAAVDYLVRSGIARERMVAKGYGESRLVNRCSDGLSCNEVEHQANRRTEIEVLRY